MCSSVTKFDETLFAVQTTECGTAGTLGAHKSKRQEKLRLAIRSNGLRQFDVHLHDGGVLASPFAISARNVRLLRRCLDKSADMAAGWIFMGLGHVAVLGGLLLRQKGSTAEEPDVDVEIS